MEEMLDVVDDDDKVVRMAPRKEVREKGLLHRCARAIVKNDNEEIMLQKRAMAKDIYPGQWDIGIAETVKSGESYNDAAIRGLHEEAGINGDKSSLKFLFKFRYKSKINNTITSAYEYYHNGAVHPQEEEVDEVKFLSKDKLPELMQKEKFHPVGKIIFEKYMEAKK